MAATATATTAAASASNTGADAPEGIRNEEKKWSSLHLQQRHDGHDTRHVHKEDSDKEAAFSPSHASSSSSTAAEAPPPPAPPPAPPLAAASPSPAPAEVSRAVGDTSPTMHAPTILKEEDWAVEEESCGPASELSGGDDASFTHMMPIVVRLHHSHAVTAATDSSAEDTCFAEAEPRTRRASVHSDGEQMIPSNKRECTSLTNTLFSLDENKDISFTDTSVCKNAKDVAISSPRRERRLPNSSNDMNVFGTPPETHTRGPQTGATTEMPAFHSANGATSEHQTASSSNTQQPHEVFSPSFSSSLSQRPNASLSRRQRHHEVFSPSCSCPSSSQLPKQDDAGGGTDPVMREWWVNASSAAEKQPHQGTALPHEDADVSAETPNLYHHDHQEQELSNASTPTGGHQTEVSCQQAQQLRRDEGLFSHQHVASPSPHEDGFQAQKQCSSLQKHPKRCTALQGNPKQWDSLQWHQDNEGVLPAERLTQQSMCVSLTPSQHQHQQQEQEEQREQQQNQRENRDMQDMDKQDQHQQHGLEALIHYPLNSLAELGSSSSCPSPLTLSLPSLVGGTSRPCKRASSSHHYHHHGHHHDHHQEEHQEQQQQEQQQEQEQKQPQQQGSAEEKRLEFQEEQSPLLLLLQQQQPVSQQQLLSSAGDLLWKMGKRIGSGSRAAAEAAANAAAKAASAAAVVTMGEPTVMSSSLLRKSLSGENGHHWHPPASEKVCKPQQKSGDTSISSSSSGTAFTWVVGGRLSNSNPGGNAPTTRGVTSNGDDTATNRGGHGSSTTSPSSGGVASINAVSGTRSDWSVTGLVNEPSVKSTNGPSSGNSPRKPQRVVKSDSVNADISGRRVYDEDELLHERDALREQVRVYQQALTQLLESPMNRVNSRPRDDSKQEKQQNIEKVADALRGERPPHVVDSTSPTFPKETNDSAADSEKKGLSGDKDSPPPSSSSLSTALGACRDGSRLLSVSDKAPLCGRRASPDANAASTTTTTPPPTTTTSATTITTAVAASTSENGDGASARTKTSESDSIDRLRRLSMSHSDGKKVSVARCANTTSHVTGKASCRYGDSDTSATQKARWDGVIEQLQEQLAELLCDRAASAAAAAATTAAEATYSIRSGGLLHGDEKAFIDQAAVAAATSVALADDDALLQRLRHLLAQAATSENPSSCYLSTPHRSTTSRRESSTDADGAASPTSGDEGHRQVATASHVPREGHSVGENKGSSRRMNQRTKASDTRQRHHVEEANTSDSGDKNKHTESKALHAGDTREGDSHDRHSDKLSSAVDDGERERLLSKIQQQQLELDKFRDVNERQTKQLMQLTLQLTSFKTEADNRNAAEQEERARHHCELEHSLTTSAARGGNQDHHLADNDAQQEQLDELAAAAAESFGLKCHLQELSKMYTKATEKEAALVRELEAVRSQLTEQQQQAARQEQQWLTSQRYPQQQEMKTHEAGGEAGETEDVSMTSTPLHATSTWRRRKQEIEECKNCVTGAPYKALCISETVDAGVQTMEVVDSEVHDQSSGWPSREKLDVLVAPEPERFVDKFRKSLESLRGKTAKEAKKTCGLEAAETAVAEQERPSGASGTAIVLTGRSPPSSKLPGAEALVGIEAPQSVSSGGKDSIGNTTAGSAGSPASASSTVETPSLAETMGEEECKQDRSSNTIQREEANEGRGHDTKVMMQRMQSLELELESLKTQQSGERRRLQRHLTDLKILCAKEKQRREKAEAQCERLMATVLERQAFALQKTSRPEGMIRGDEENPSSHYRDSALPHHVCPSCMCPLSQSFTIYKSRQKASHVGMRVPADRRSCRPNDNRFEDGSDRFATGTHAAVSATSVQPPVTLLPCPDDRSLSHKVGTTHNDDSGAAYTGLIARWKRTQTLESKEIGSERIDSLPQGDDGTNVLSSTEVASRVRTAPGTVSTTHDGRLTAATSERTETSTARRADDDDSLSALSLKELQKAYALAQEELQRVQESQTLLQEDVTRKAEIIAFLFKKYASEQECFEAEDVVPFPHSFPWKSPNADSNQSGGLGGKLRTKELKAADLQNLVEKTLAENIRLRSDLATLGFEYE